MAHVEKREWRTKAGQRRSAWRVVWVDPATGRRRRSEGFPNKKSAEEERTRILIALRGGEMPSDHGTSVGEWLNQWLEIWAHTPTRRYGKVPAPATVKLKCEEIERHLLPYVGKLPLAKFTRMQASEWWTTLGSPSVAVPPRTRTQVLHTVRSAMRAAVARGMIVRDPTEGLEAPRQPESQVNARATELTDEMAEEIIKALPAWARGPARMMQHLGLRTGEALGMDWCDVACHDGEITELRIQASARYVDGQGSPTRADTKTHRARVIPIPSSAIKILREEWEAQGRPTSGPCWPSALAGGIAAPRTFRRAWRQAVKRAGAPKGTRAYDLRHVVGTRLVAAGVPAPDAAAFLGHSARVLLSTYAKPTPRGTEAILGALGPHNDDVAEG